MALPRQSPITLSMLRRPLPYEQGPPRYAGGGEVAKGALSLLREKSKFLSDLVKKGKIPKISWEEFTAPKPGYASEIPPDLERYVPPELHQSPALRNIVRSYTGGQELSPEDLAALEKLTRESQLPLPMSLYRGVARGVSAGTPGVRGLPQSLSADPLVSRDFAFRGVDENPSVLYRLNAPKGAPIAPIWAASSLPVEQEALLGPQSRLKIKQLYIPEDEILKQIREFDPAGRPVSRYTTSPSVAPTPQEIINSGKTYSRLVFPHELPAFMADVEMRRKGGPVGYSGGARPPEKGLIELKRGGGKVENTGPAMTQEQARQYFSNALRELPSRWWEGLKSGVKRWPQEALEAAEFVPNFLLGSPEEREIQARYADLPPDSLMPVAGSAATYPMGDPARAMQQATRILNPMQSPAATLKAAAPVAKGAKGALTMLRGAF